MLELTQTGVENWLSEGEKSFTEILSHGVAALETYHNETDATKKNQFYGATLKFVKTVCKYLNDEKVKQDELKNSYELISNLFRFLMFQEDPALHAYIDLISTAIASKVKYINPLLVLIISKANSELGEALLGNLWGKILTGSILESEKDEYENTLLHTLAALLTKPDNARFFRSYFALLSHQTPYSKNGFGETILHLLVPMMNQSDELFKVFDDVISDASLDDLIEVNNEGKNFMHLVIQNITKFNHGQKRTILRTVQRKLYQEENGDYFVRFGDQLAVSRALMVKKINFEEYANVLTEIYREKRGVTPGVVGGGSASKGKGAVDSDLELSIFDVTTNHALTNPAEYGMELDEVKAFITQDYEAFGISRSEYEEQVLHTLQTNKRKVDVEAAKKDLRERMPDFNTNTASHNIDPRFAGSSAAAKTYSDIEAALHGGDPNVGRSPSPVGGIPSAFSHAAGDMSTLVTSAEMAAQERMLREFAEAKARRAAGSGTASSVAAGSSSSAPAISASAPALEESGTPSELAPDVETLLVEEMRYFELLNRGDPEWARAGDDSTLLGVSPAAEGARTVAITATSSTGARIIDTLVLPPDERATDAQRMQAFGDALTAAAAAGEDGGADTPGELPSP